MKQKRRKKRKGSNRGVTSICFIVLILLVILSVQSQGLKEKLKVYAAQQEELQQKIDSETARTDEIKKLEEYQEHNGVCGRDRERQAWPGLQRRDHLQTLELIKKKLSDRAAYEREPDKP